MLRVVLIQLLKIIPFYTYTISGKSMLPTLHQGEKVLVNRWAYLFKHPKKNEIVAVKDPRDGKILIKRIKKIEKGKYFVVGDNKSYSTDSREFGMLEKDAIIGKVIFIK